jgi:DNA polymerase III alpha subunit
MNYDQYGQCWTTPDELCDMLYENPTLDLSAFHVKFGGEQAGRDVTRYNDAVKSLYADFPFLKTLRQIDSTVEEFDADKQSRWHMPDEYRELDIAQYVLDLCKTDAEMQRVGQELLLYMERDLFNLLRYLKYFVDTMRANNIVWGLGRGSSVASYVLFLIGVHKIDSLFYDLPIEEFLK